MIAAERPGAGRRVVAAFVSAASAEKPDQPRTAFFPEWRTPALFVHGTRDPFGSLEELRDAIARIPARVDLLAVEGAGHDLKPAARMAGEILLPHVTLRNKSPRGISMREYRYTTPHGIQVTRSASKTNFRKGLQHLLDDLDQHRGIYLSSGYEYPGRYSRWDIASTCPPLEIISYDRRVEFRPLNARGVKIGADASPRAGGSPALGRFRVRRRDAGRPAEAAARAVPRGGAQQTALGLLDPARC